MLWSHPVQNYKTKIVTQQDHINIHIPSIANILFAAMQKGKPLKGGKLSSWIPVVWKM